MFVVGEVVNGATAPIFSVRVIATFYDNGGNLVGAQEAPALLPAAASRQAIPFKIQLSPAPANVKRYELALTWDDLSVATYDRVTVSREEVSNDGGVTISGELRNDHSAEISNIMVVATFYDASGVVVDVFSGAVENPTLGPGATTAFTVQTNDPNLTYNSYLVQTQGMMGR
jgi:hypothetical protein